VVVRAYNECGNRYTDVDLLGLIEWSRSHGQTTAAPTVAHLSTSE
jgi:hypothetical protein